MIYRIRIDLAFDSQGVAQGLENHALGVFPQAHTINPGQDEEEKGYIIVEECYHDETPHQPCDVLSEHYTD